MEHLKNLWKNLLCHSEQGEESNQRIMNHNYFVYILTNIHRQVLYIGVTNNLRRRIFEHREGSELNGKSFAAKYNCIYLIYWERFQYIQHAILREKELKGWKRERKLALIRAFNPEFKFLNNELE